MGTVLVGFKQNLDKKHMKICDYASELTGEARRVNKDRLLVACPRFLGLCVSRLILRRLELRIQTGSMSLVATSSD